MKKRFPGWIGLWEQLESLNLYFWLFWCSAVALAGSIYNVARTRTLASQSKEISDLRSTVGSLTENVHEVMDLALLALSTKIGLQGAGTERLSLYVHNKETKSFVPCGRFSHNPNFKLKGRTSFPDTKGCISEAWDSEWHYVNNLPDPSRGTGYEDYMAKNYRMTKAVVRALRMKPRTIAAMRLSHDSFPIAVIVVESTLPQKFDEVFLKTHVEEFAPMYARLIVAFRPYIPDPRRAQEAGL